MKVFKTQVLLILIINTFLILNGCGPKPATHSPLTVIKSNEGYLFSEGDRRIMFYQVEPRSLEGKYERCNYVHPLYGLDGQVLTEDFPKDHPHHRGIFWAWHQLLIGDKHISDNWGLNNFGINYGIVFTAWGIGGFIMGRLSQMLQTSTGSYTYSFLTASVLLIIGALLTLTLKGRKEAPLPLKPGASLSYGEKN